MKQIGLILALGLVLFLASCGNPVVFSGPTNINVSKTKFSAGEELIITITRPYELQNGTGEKLFKAKLGICFVDNLGNCKVNTNKNNEVDLPSNIELSAGNQGAVFGQYSATTSSKIIEHEVALTSTVSGTYSIKGFFLYDSGSDLESSKASLSKEITITFE